MTPVVLTCVALVMLTTLLHYEALRLMSVALPRLRMAHHARMIIVILGAFLAHTLEIILYALGTYALMHVFEAGTLEPSVGPNWATALYFSAETYTSLGYGDVVPTGPLRTLAGVEALNGLLLIGWSASFTYVAMQRFWDDARAPRKQEEEEEE